MELNQIRVHKRSHVMRTVLFAWSGRDQETAAIGAEDAQSLRFIPNCCGVRSAWVWKIVTNS